MNPSGILADEMGLGKTVQTLAFLGGLGESNLAKTALVILTTSLLTSKDNWTKEFPIWCPKWKVSGGGWMGAAEREGGREGGAESGYVCCVYRPPVCAGLHIPRQSPGEAVS